MITDHDAEPHRQRYRRVRRDRPALGAEHRRHGTGIITGTPDAADPATATATVTVTDTAGNPTDVSITFPMVAKGDQKLTDFSYRPATVMFGDAAPTATPPTGVRTTLSYTATPPGVCTVNATSGALTLAGVGDCVVTATAESTDNYNPAMADFTVTVAKGEQILTGFLYTPTTVNFGDAAPTVTVPTGAQGTLSYTATPAEVCTVDATSGALTLAGAGECVVTATAESTDNYNPAMADFTVTVAKGEQTLTGFGYRPATVNFGDAAPTVTAPTGAEGPLSYAATPAEVCTVNATSGALTLAGAGECVVTATAESTDNYNPAMADFTVTVAKGEQTLTGFLYTPATVNFGDAAPTLTAPTGAEGPLSYAATPAEVCTVNATSGALTLAGAGECVVTATAEETANYIQATADFTVTVAKGEQILTGFLYTPTTVNFGDAAPTLTAPTGAEGPLSYAATPAEVCTVNATSGALTLAGAGECVVTATAEETANYIQATADFTVTVAKGDQTLAGFGYSPATVTFGDAAPTLTAPGEARTTVSYTATPPGVCTVNATSGALTLAGAGECVVTATAEETANYIQATADFTVTVAKGEQILTGFLYTPATVTFGGPAPTVTPPTGVQTTLSYMAAPVEVCTVDMSTGAMTLAGVGECVVIATAEGTANYNQATADFTVTVQPAGTLVLDLDAIAGDDTVNLAEHAAGFAISGDTGSVGDVSVTVTVGGTELTATSTATAWSVDVPANAAYITGASVTVTVSATKTGFTAASPVTRTLTVDLTAPSVSYTAPDALKVGVAIADLAPSATATDIASWAANGLPSGLTIDAGTGVITGTPDTANDNPATATVTVTDTAGNPTDVPIAFPMVAKGDQPLTGFDYRPATVMFGDPAPTATPPTGVRTTLSYSAAPAEVCAVNPSTGAMTLAGVGECVVTATAEATANYNEATLDFTVTVRKGDQILTGFGYTPATVTFGDAAPSVTAPAGVRTTLSYTAAPADVCTVDMSTGELMLVETGTCMITAIAAGTANYNEATADATVIVQPAGALVLNLDPIAADDTINLAEHAAGFAISGDTGSEAGVSVTVTVGGTELTATSTATAWSVSVPADAAYITGTSVTVTVSAIKIGFTAASPVTRPLTVDLSAPSASYTAPDALKVGVAIADLAPSTTATDIASYAATGLPSGLVIDGTSGVITGTPDTADDNPATATVTVTDTAGNPTDVPIAFPMVAKGDQPLTGFAYSSRTVTFGDTAPTAMPPTGVRTTLSYSAAPADVCTVDMSTGALTLAGVGDCVVTATAAGTADYNQATAGFTVTVQPAGTLALNLDAIATDDTVNIAEKAAGFTISGDTGTEGDVTVTVTVATTELTATSGARGAWSVHVPANAAYITGTSVTVMVSAAKTGFTSASDVTRPLTVDLTAPAAPTYTALRSLKVGAAISMSPIATATDIASYRATGLPSGLTIDAGTGIITGTPDTANDNPATATVTVTDTAGNPTAVQITFPMVAKGDQELTGFAYSSRMVTFGQPAPTVTPPTGVRTSLRYATTSSSVCTVAATTGALTLVGVGDCVVTATAEGTANYNQATATATVTVEPAGALVLNLDPIATDDTVNSAEHGDGFPISGDTGLDAGVTVRVTLGSQPPLTATSAANGDWVVRVPANAAYITGTSVTVTVSASKTGFTPASDVTRMLAVDLAAPSASYVAPDTLQVGEAIVDMTPSTTATDIAAYRATGLPPGLSINATTGVISGTPDTADRNQATATATVTVTDTAGNPVEVSIRFPAVTKGVQTLAGFGYSFDTVTFGQPAPTVTPPTGARTTVSYAATPFNVCEVYPSTGDLKLLAVGTCVVTATAVGTANYNESSATVKVIILTSAPGQDPPVEALLVLTPGSIDEDGGRVDGDRDLERHVG